MNKRIACVAALLSPNLACADDGLIGTAVAIPITPHMATPHGVYKMTTCIGDGAKFLVTLNTKTNSSAISVEGSHSHIPGTWSHIEQKGISIFMPSGQINWFIADPDTTLASSYVFTDSQRTGKVKCDPFVLVTYDREVSW